MTARAAGVRSTAIMVMAGLLAVGSGCTTGTSRWDDGPSATLAVGDSHLSFRLTAPSSSHVAAGHLTSREGCPGLHHTLVGAGKTPIVDFTAYASACPPASNGSTGNGDHGTYRSAADIPAGLAAKASRVTTPIGDAVVFTQRYFECTNSCRRWNEPLAVVALTRPTDPAYPTLVVRADPDLMDQKALAAFVRDRLQP